MPLLSQAPSGVLSAQRCTAPSSSLPFTNPRPPLFSKDQPRLPSRPARRPPSLILVSLDGRGEPGASATRTPVGEETVFVGKENVPLEGVIQFEKPDETSKLRSWAQVGLLAGGDVLCLLTFSVIGRLNHELPVLDWETVRTADPFIAGWFLSAYFLGGYSEEGRGENGYFKAIVAAIKSWVLGIPLGLAVRATISRHIPLTTFIFVTMGSTGILLIGWRALICKFLIKRQSQRNDVYKRGSPFELFELLMSLVRRW